MQRNRLKIVATLLIVSLALTAVKADIYYYVSNDGNDTWPGTLAQPFKTIAKAQTVVRALPRPLTQHVRVNIRGNSGVYYNQSLSFNQNDSGNNTGLVIYQGYPGDPMPIFSGGKNVSDWTVDNGVWTKQLPVETTYFSQLYVKGPNDMTYGQRRYRPRVPSGTGMNGYHFIAGTAAGQPVAYAGSHTGYAYNAFIYSGNDILSTWTNLSDVELCVFQIWEMARLPISSVDPVTHTVTSSGYTYDDGNGHRLIGPTNPSLGKNSSGQDLSQQYLCENVYEAGTTGNFYYNRSTRVLTYWPLAGETPANTTVVYPQQSSLLEITGTSSTQAQWLYFAGLRFAHSNWNVPVTGQNWSQSDANMPAAVTLTWATRCTFSGCVIEHTGQYGIHFNTGCSYDSYQDSCLIDLGAGGCKIGDNYVLADWQYQTTDPNPPHHITLHNNVIKHGGRVQPGASGVWIGNGWNNTVDHNDIYDLYYNGISVGFFMNYYAVYGCPSWTHDNTISYNDIRKIGQTVLTDMGGIYVNGEQTGTQLLNNLIHDVDVYGYALGVGIYMDAHSAFITARDNIVYNARICYYQNWGKSNTVTNNIFTKSRACVMLRGKYLEADPSSWSEISGNIIYAVPGTLSGVQFPASSTAFADSSFYAGLIWGDHIDTDTFDYNLYYNPNYPLHWGSSLFAQWQAQFSQDANSIVANPLFTNQANPELTNFALENGSPAYTIGFQAIDLTTIGDTWYTHVPGDTSDDTVQSAWPLPGPQVP